MTVLRATIFLRISGTAFLFCGLKSRSEIRILNEKVTELSDVYVLNPDDYVNLICAEMIPAVNRTYADFQTILAG